MATSADLPKDFRIGVIAHNDWNNDADATARYSLAVTFEVVKREIRIHDELMAAIQKLQQEIELEAEVSEVEM